MTPSSVLRLCERGSRFIEPMNALSSSTTITFACRLDCALGRRDQVLLLLAARRVRLQLVELDAGREQRRAIRCIRCIDGVGIGRGERVRQHCDLDALRALRARDMRRLCRRGMKYGEISRMRCCAPSSHSRTRGARWRSCVVDIGRHLVRIVGEERRRAPGPRVRRDASRRATRRLRSARRRRTSVSRTLRRVFGECLAHASSMSIGGTSRMLERFDRHRRPAVPVAIEHVPNFGDDGTRSA